MTAVPVRFYLTTTISDNDYRRERISLERQLKIATPDPNPIHMPNLERAAQLLNNLPLLWSHPGVTNEQRETLAQEVFHKITIDGKSLIAIEPKPAYAPLFAAMLIQNPLGYCETNQGRNHIFNIISWTLSRMCLVGRGERIRTVSLSLRCLGTSRYWA